MSLPCYLRHTRACALPSRSGGGAVRRLELSWTRYGTVGAPTVVVLGGLSSDRFVADARDRRGWWPQMVGPGLALDPRRVGILGFDYAVPVGAEPLGTGEQADALAAVLDAEGIGRAHAIVGASYGAMVALAFGAAHPDRVARLVAISGTDRPHPMATALRSVQRRIVRFGIASGRALDALALARSLAMVSYRTPEELAARFDGAVTREDGSVRAPIDAWLERHGARFAERISPERFLALSASLDLHRIDPTAVKVPTLLIGATCDPLVPIADLRRLRDALPDARLVELDSPYGHDAFLKEARSIDALLRHALTRREVAA